MVKTNRNFYKCIAFIRVCTVKENNTFFHFNKKKFNAFVFTRDEMRFVKCLALNLNAFEFYAK